MENQKRARGRPKSIFKESSAGTMQSLDRALQTLSMVAKLERCNLTELSRATSVPAPPPPIAFSRRSLIEDT